MAGDASEIHVVTRGDLARGTADRPWRDPDGILEMEEARRAALLANPLAVDDDEPVQLVGTRGGEVIGRLDLVKGSMRVDGHDLDCLWGSALVVPERHRRTLMGISLILKAQALAEVAGAAGPSQVAYSVYSRLKWMDVTLPRYVLMRRSRAVVDRLVSPPLRGVAACVADPVLVLHQSLLGLVRKAAGRGLRTSPADRLPPDVEARVISDVPNVSFHRSNRWLEWLLGHSFERDPRNRRALHLVHDRSGAVVAYFLVKSRFYPQASQRGFRDVYLGSLHDWVILDPQSVSFEHIVLFAVHELARWDVDAVEVCIPPDVVRPRLGRLGFRRVGEMHVVVRPAASSMLALPENADSSRWRVRPGEGDYSFS